MKKYFFILPFTVLLLCLSACSLDNESTGRHQVMVYYPERVNTLFADQTQDSVMFTTFDSFDVISLSTPWLKVINSKDYPSSAKIANNYNLYYAVRVNLEFEPNTTNACRYGLVRVRSYGGDWDESVTAHYYQLCWHNIMHPVPTYERDANLNVVACKYERKDSALQTIDTLRFEAYDKWTLESSADSYITLPVTSGEAGKYTLLLPMTQNESTAPRKSVLTLESENGAKTVLTFTQDGKK